MIELKDIDRTVDKNGYNNVSAKVSIEGVFTENILAIMSKGYISDEELLKQVRGKYKNTDNGKA